MIFLRDRIPPSPPGTACLDPIAIAVHCVDRTSIDELGGAVGVPHMYLHTPMKFQLQSHRVNLFGYRECTHKTRSQVTGLNAKRQTLGGEPNPLTSDLLVAR